LASRTVAPPAPFADRIGRPFSEAHDSRDEANDALDQIERCVERVLAAGGEFALRRRLAQALGPGKLIEG
jgi:hypothetical protein